MARLEVTSVFVKDGRTEFRCGETLIFSVPSQVPEKFQLSQEEWERAMQMCVDARVKGNWVGNDILNPTPFGG